VLADDSEGSVSTAVVGLFMTVTKDFIQLLLYCDRPVVVEDDNWCLVDVVLRVCVGPAASEREHLADPEAKLCCTDRCIWLV
jgi:hypothetical protein